MDRAHVIGLGIIVTLASLPTAHHHWGRPSRSIESRRSAVSTPAPPRTPNPWFFLERAYPQGRIPKDAWRQAQLEAAALKQQAGPRSGSWTFRGPTNIGGRVTDLAVDPLDANVVYAGAAEGGVLRSTDAGQHWIPLFDEQATLSIGAIALDPSDNDVLYAGTGEVNPGGGSVAYGGAGIFRSTDRGDSWSALGLEEAGSIGRIRIDPADPNRIFVAAMGDLWEKGPNRGVYRSTDAGANWERVLFVSDSTGCVDLIQRPDQPNTLFAAMWERIRRPNGYQYGGTTSSVYRSTDGGAGWTIVSSGLPAPSTQGGRIGLSLCAAQPDYLHAVYAARNGDFAGLYRSTNGGATWVRTNDGGLSGSFATYGWWFGNVRTHPVDPNRIFVVGFDVYRSINGGSSWSLASNGVHVDHHAFEFGSGASPVMYNGNDGGVYRSSNGGTGWSKLPDLPITQAYRLALDAGNSNAIYIGAQDNGTIRTLSGAINDWVEIFGGDGFQPLVHPTNSNRVWAEYQYGALNYSANGGGSWVDATGGISGADRRNWNTAVRIDPTDASRMYYGTNRVYRSTNGTTWGAVSPDLTHGANGGQQGQVYGTLTTLAVSPLDGAVLWAGSDDGRVHVSTNSGTVWTDVSNLLPDRWITSVRTDPLDRETAYVTISGFRWGSPLPHVFRTTNLGLNWLTIASNLPEAPANDLIVDPLDTNRLWVATDVGVYETLDGGGTWHALGGNLPNVVVTSLALDASGRTLVAATYGRSCFSYDIDQPSAVPDALAGRNPLLPPEPNPARSVVHFSWQRTNLPVRLVVVTVSGREVFEHVYAADATSGNWNLHDSSGRRVGPGVYYARLEIPGRPPNGRSIVVAP